MYNQLHSPVIISDTFIHLSLIYKGNNSYAFRVKKKRGRYSQNPAGKNRFLNRNLDFIHELEHKNKCDVPGTYLFYAQSILTTYFPF